MKTDDLNDEDLEALYREMNLEQLKAKETHNSFTHSGYVEDEDEEANVCQYKSSDEEGEDSWQFPDGNRKRFFDYENDCTRNPTPRIVGTFKNIISKAWKKLKAKILRRKDKTEKTISSKDDKKIGMKIMRKKRKIKKLKIPSKAKQIPSAPMLYFAFSINSGFFRPHSKMPQRLEKLCKVRMER